jgi:ABC-type spermidine/putrescine transport system permease subunit II
MRNLLKIHFVLSLVGSQILAVLGFYLFFTKGENGLLKIAVGSLVFNALFYFLFIHNKSKKIERG